MPNTGRCSEDTLEERFWDKVKKTENCWLWKGAVNNKGYGKIGLGHGWVLAHRVSWILHNGDIPNKLFVLHSCDTPGCVNPDHMSLGTQAENLADMWSKGRWKRKAQSA